MPEPSLPPTRVGVLGVGDVGRVFARGFAGRGHDVMIGTRDPSKPEVAEWLSGEGAGVKAGTFAETAAHAEIVVLAVKGVAVEEAIAQAGTDNVDGKVVIDATNPLDFSEGFPPKLAWGHDDSGGEHVQRAAPGARVVKAFNIIGSPYFVGPGFPGGMPTMFVAGDDGAAKETVGKVLADFGWPPAVDIGGIEGSRVLEPLCILWVMIGGSRGAWDHGFALLTG